MIDKLKRMRGKYVGRRTAHVIDVTYGGSLCVCFGRLPREAWRNHQVMTVSYFKRWCTRWKARKVKP